jgi:hypothetical protein
MVILNFWSQDSPFGVTMGYGLDGLGSIPGSARSFLLSIPFRPALGPTQPPIQWLLGAISLEVKGQG